MFGDENKLSGVNITSPVETYLEWKKNKETQETGFITYDKDLECEAMIKVDKFVVIDEAYQIRGYNQKLKAYLKSNIIAKKKEEEFVVMHDGQELYRGIYDPEMKPSWATLYRVLTVNLDGRLTRLVLKPSASKEYIYTFVKEFDDKGLPTEWLDYDTRYKNFVEMTGEEKKESSFGEYVVPKFKLGKKLSDADIKQTTDLANQWKEYLDSIKQNKDDERKSLEGSN